MTTLGYAILGLLARESLSGYDLTQRMKGRVGFFWSARHSQIYPELARLEGDGFVTHSVVEQRDRPDKKVYEITASGLQALKGWITQPPPEKPTRDELTLKAYSVWLADGGEAARVFREEGLKHEEQLARYEEIRARMEDEWREGISDPGSPQFASYATLRRGIIHERGYAEWCRWLAEAVGGEVPISGRGGA
ncbi:PadR family transcriptional regulator [Rubrobacter marinus]|uniref:PadR family transcriptional regulator n=1 Tax=Rubrobacter marinus TaxID=2653852 RepID=A0A6G8PSB6_9ACTN|nr:PadR family transcriptional regulator [Rubrobacter marinus]QIN77264.1 PadR family transcriptional regulator [Rubrobacter marinus]